MLVTVLRPLICGVRTARSERGVAFAGESAERPLRTPEAWAGLRRHLPAPCPRPRAAGGFGDFSVARHEDGPFPEAGDSHRPAAEVVAGVRGDRQQRAGQTHGAGRAARGLPAAGSPGSLWLLQMPTFPLLIL